MTIKVGDVILVEREFKHKGFAGGMAVCSQITKDTYEFRFISPAPSSWFNKEWFILTSSSLDKVRVIA